MQTTSNPELEKKLAAIRLIVSDVDGVLTDGKIYFDAKGEEMKVFSCREGFRTDAWLASGGTLVWFTGRKCEGVVSRAKELEADLIFKADLSTDLFVHLKSHYGVDAGEVLYIGDDWNDLYYMQGAGVSVAPHNATKEAQEVASFITETNGGEGVLSEVIERILRAQEKWESVVEKYKKAFIV